MRVLLVTGWLTLAAGPALACPPLFELPEAVAGGAEADLPRAALHGLAAVVRALEPAFPRTVIAATLAVPEDDPLHADLRYLRERRAIPRDLDLGSFDRVTWQSLIDTLTGWYGLPPRAAGPFDSVESVRADLERALGRIMSTVRPVALLAWDPDDDQRLAFVGVMWNWSPYPRLIVQRPPEGWSMRDGARELASRLQVCGVSVGDYIAASEPVARDLFLANSTATMYLVGSEPESTGAWPYQVPEGEEIRVFAFEHPEVRDLDAFSAVFVGERVPIVSMLRLLPSVRTNLSPVGLARVLQTPQ